MRDIGEGGLQDTIKGKKLALISPRYGTEVNGGAELQCRMFAEHLAAAGYDVTVLTTTAKDYHTWENEYGSGDEVVNGIKVKRFYIEGGRSKALKRYNRLFRLLLGPAAMEEKWIRLQGPYVPLLAEHIRDHSGEYDVFLFFTYMYYPTIAGMPYVYERSIFIPEAHDEPVLYFRCVRRLFLNAAARFFNTPEEKALVEKRFGRTGKGKKEIVTAIGGIGIEPPDVTDAGEFKDRYDLDRYILYAGRISKGKGCDELIRFYRSYKARSEDTGLKLVMLGSNEDIDLSDHKTNEDDTSGGSDIIMPGFVADEDKWRAIAGAEAVVVPSRFESLSMILLEAMALGVPVLANEKSEVLKAHIDRSKGGWTYADEAGFYKSLCEILGKGEPQISVDALLRNEAVVKERIENGKRYIETNYRWENIIARLTVLIDVIVRSQNR